MDNNFFVITFSVTSDCTTGKEWIARLKAKGFCVGDYAESVLLSKSFKPTSDTYEIAVLKGEIFSDRDRTTKNIHEEAKNRKFTVPNVEIACLIREKFSDKELEAMGLYWIITMHEPIRDSGGDYVLLGAGRGNRDPRLSTFHENPGDGWGCGGGFAFVVSQALGSLFRILELY